MAYCRWSSADWSCDIYAYEAVGGSFIIHVAGNRILGEIPKVPRLRLDMTPAEVMAWGEAHQRQMDFVKSAERQDIDLPHAGETFDEETSQAFKERLLMLRQLGYRIPDYVFEAIDEEMKGES